MRLTNNEARVVSMACEFYARIKMGQFGEVLWHCLDIREEKENFSYKREDAEKLLLAIRRKIYPELWGAGHSYGIGKFKDADTAYDIHQVIDYQYNHPREPFSLHELPKINKFLNGGCKLDLTDYQKDILKAACSFYYRVRTGHLKNIVTLCGSQADCDEEIVQAKKLIYFELDGESYEDLSKKKFSDAVTAKLISERAL